MVVAHASAQTTIDLANPQPHNPGGGDGQTYYVAPDGDDNAAGTEEAPWKTIQKAANTLKPGETVLIKNGDYRERQDQYKNIQIERRGEPGQYITFRAFPGHQPTIHVDTWNGIQLWNARYVEIDGLFVRGIEKVEKVDPKNPKHFGNGITIAGPEGSAFIRIRNCRVTSVGGCGIGGGTCDQVLVENNRVWGTSHRNDAGTSGFSFISPKPVTDITEGYGIVIRNNVSYDNHNTLPFKHAGYITDGNGIILDWFVDEKPESYPRRTLVMNNVCFGNGGRGIHVYKYHHADIIHNTVYHNLKTPVLQKHEGNLSAVGASDVRFINNISVASDGTLAFNLQGENLRSSHNLFFGGRPLADRINETDLVADPLLVQPSLNFEEADFRLKEGSPAIDAADPAWSATADFDQRPRDDRADLGAFEYSGTTSSPMEE